MIIRVGLGVFALALLSAPAMAAGQCDTSGPVQPAMPTPAELTAMAIPDAQARINTMFQDLHLYQKQLKTYRDCLNAAMAADQSKVNTGAAQKDPAQKKAAQEEYARYAQAYNESVDAEKTLADQINTDTKAHCARDTSDFCKPKN
jgi:hypothetical protein